MALLITITNAGRAEIINAQNTGTDKVTITAVAFGTGQYTPSKAQTALQAEVKRVGSIAGQAVAADTIHVMALDESSAAYNVGEFGLISDKGTLIAVYSQLPAAGWIIQKAAPSTLLLATDIILESLDTSVIEFGDISFINPPATTETPGVVQLEDSLTSTSTSKALTAKQGKALQDSKQPLHANLSALAGLLGVADRLPYFTGAGALSLTTLTAFARSLLDDASATDARQTLGLGSAAQQPSSAFVSTSAASRVKHAGAPLITFERDGTTNAVIRIAHAAAALYLGLSSSGELRLGPEADVSQTGRRLLDTGDTTAFSRLLLLGDSALASRQILGAQAADDTLTALAAVVTAADKLIYSTGVDTFATSTLTDFARSLLDDADAAAARTTLGAQPLDATLTALAAVVTAADKLIYSTGVDTFATSTLTAFARSLLDDADAAAARTTLGAQPLDATLTALAAVVTAADKLIYSTGVDTFATSTLTAFARSLLDDADAASARATLGAQPLDATLTALAAVVTAADRLIYSTGVDTFATSTLTAFARSLLDDASATDARQTLGLGSAAQQPSSAFVSTNAASVVKHAGAPLITFERDGTTNAVIRIAHAAAELYLGLTSGGELRIGPDPDIASTGHRLYHAMNLGNAFQRQIGDNGYLKLPDAPGLPGFIIQWGQTAATVGGGNQQHSATFPVAFPNACFAVVPGTLTGTPIGAGAQLMAQLIAKTLTGFTWFSDALEESSQGTIGVTYIAIGN